MRQKRIFNHDIMHCTHDAVVGNYLYCGRVLGMSEPGDLIQLHPDLQSEWDEIVSHYQRIGLTHSHNPIWDVSFEKLAQYPDYEVSVFIFGDAVHETNSDNDWFRDRNQDWLNVVNFINSKNNFIRLANELEVKVPTTVCFDNKLELADYQDLPLPCYLKPAISVDGVGIYRCENQQQLEEILANFDSDLPLQVQQEVITSKFLNLQYEITSQGVQPLAATEQILDGYSHSGNRYPTVHQPWELLDPMAEWLEKKGMKGIFAFDVAAVEQQADTDYLAIECNPRFNGASYPTGVARKLKLDNWASETLNTQHRSLADIDLSEIEFDPYQGTGVVIVNWGSVLAGKLGVLFAGTIAEQQQLKTLLQQRL